MMKLRKVRNDKMWKADNGTIIQYNPFFENYTINKGTFFEFAKSLEEAKEIANSDYHFNR